MALSFLNFNEQPLGPAFGERARFFGYSIIKDSEYISERYEVMDTNGDIHRFDTDEALAEYLKQELPGCFLEEG